MKFLVVGVGAVGARAARQLASTEHVEDVALFDPRPGRTAQVADALGRPTRAVGDPLGDTQPDVVLLATPAGEHVSEARRHLERGSHVVSLADELDDVRGLLDLDPEARERDRTVVVGAGFAPGLTCVLARHAAAGFDAVEEVLVAKVGTGGPACARQHHRALADRSFDWREGRWEAHRGGSGRQLCWFPDPVGGQDCYRAALPDALLLVPAFPGVSRVSSRVSANRRDRLSGRLPMLRPPHPEGRVGAVRVEVRGRRGQARDGRVLGVMDRPATAAAAVSALAGVWAARGQLQRPGAAGLAELLDPVPYLGELARRGIKAAVFEGAAEAVPG